MKRSIIIRPEAEADIAAAFDWNEEQRQEPPPIWEVCWYSSSLQARSGFDPVERTGVGCPTRNQDQPSAAG